MRVPLFLTPRIRITSNHVESILRDQPPSYVDQSRPHCAHRRRHCAGRVRGVAIRVANVEVLRSFEDSVIAVAGRATIQVTGGELGLDERLMANVSRHPDVVSATPMLQLTARVIEGPLSGRVLPIVAFDLLEARDIQKVRFQYQDGAGASLDKILAPEAIFVGARLAAEWPLRQGTTLRLAAGMQDYRVTVKA